MGASSSTLDPSSPSPPGRALHVLRVAPGSPADGFIEPFFDFLVGVDGNPLGNNVDTKSLSRMVEEHEGKTLPLLIWSAKYRQMRVVPITPSRTWSQGSSSNANEPPSLLELSMRVCTPEHALDSVWHILEVLEGSPAESAGLVPYGDWVVGWSGGVLSGENAFYDLVEAHIDKPLRAIVYSYDFDSLREIVLVPNRKWGGEGLLGCGVGYGLLHRIPPQPANSQSMDTILKQNLPYDEQDLWKGDNPTLFVPADDENFEFGGRSGQVTGEGEDEDYRQPSATQTEEFDETPMAHWHAANNNSGSDKNNLVHPTPPESYTANEHGHGEGPKGTESDHSHSHSQSHSHSHSQQQQSTSTATPHSHSHSYSHSPSESHSHSHSHSPQPTSTVKGIKGPSPLQRRSDSISSLKSLTGSPLTPPPRAATPTQSGVPTMSHTFAYREARNSLSNIVKPEPLRRLSSPPIAPITTSTSTSTSTTNNSTNTTSNASGSSPRQRMRGGIVRSPANSRTGTPTRVKSPEAQPVGHQHKPQVYTSSLGGAAGGHSHGDDDDDGEESDSTSRKPGSLSGSVTSVD